MEELLNEKLRIENELGWVNMRIRECTKYISVHEARRRQEYKTLMKRAKSKEQ